MDKNLAGADICQTINDVQLNMPLCRVSNTSITPTSFEEVINYNRECPHRVTIKKFIADENVPLHFASSLEIILTENVIGEFTVDNHCFQLRNDQVILVPPKALHSDHVLRCDGTMYAIKLSPEAMKQFMDIENILGYNKLSLSQLAFTCPESEKIKNIVNCLIVEDSNIYARLRCILSLLEVLSKYMIRPSSDIVEPPLKQTELKALITWTHDNYCKKITLDDAAKIVKFSKHYFCKWFKSLTGMTYLGFVNHVRIAQACQMLVKGLSVSECGIACGFENVSYFIQCFKQIQGCTPKVYIQKLLHGLES